MNLVRLLLLNSSNGDNLPSDCRPYSSISLGNVPRYQKYLLITHLLKKSYDMEFKYYLKLGKNISTVLQIQTHHWRNVYLVSRFYWFQVKNIILMADSFTIYIYIYIVKFKRSILLTVNFLFVILKRLFRHKNCVWKHNFIRCLNVNSVQALTKIERTKENLSLKELTMQWLANKEAKNISSFSNSFKSIIN